MTIINLGTRVVNNYLISSEAGRILIDTERFRDLDFPYEVLETPGHTSDHIALLVGDLLFCGDAAMNGFPSCRRTTIWIEDLPQFKRSWERILKRSPRLLCPAHGKPFPTADLKKYRKALDKVKLRALKENRMHTAAFKRGEQT